MLPQGYNINEVKERVENAIGQMNHRQLLYLVCTVALVGGPASIGIICLFFHGTSAAICFIFALMELVTIIIFSWTGFPFTANVSQH